MIGEWTSRELFPPPKHGSWPKNGHDGILPKFFQMAASGWANMEASLIGTAGLLPLWCKQDRQESVRLAPGCDVCFRVAPAPLTLHEELCLLGLWTSLSVFEASKNRHLVANGWHILIHKRALTGHTRITEARTSQTRELKSFSLSRMHLVKVSSSVKMPDKQFVSSYKSGKDGAY